MKVTVYKQVQVSAEVNYADIGSYLARTGWTLEKLGEWTDVVHTYQVARWTRGDVALTLRGVGTEEEMVEEIGYIAEAEDRQTADLLQDIVGHEILDRGTAIVRRNSAMAKARDAMDVLDRTPRSKAADYERARVALAQADQEVERATAALRAAEGVGT
jgi:hypothetical protein